MIAWESSAESGCEEQVMSESRKRSQATGATTAMPYAEHLARTRRVTSAGIAFGSLRSNHNAEQVALLIKMTSLEAERPRRARDVALVALEFGLYGGALEGNEPVAECAVVHVIVGGCGG